MSVLSDLVAAIGSGQVYEQGASLVSQAIASGASRTCPSIASRTETLLAAQFVDVLWGVAVLAPALREEYGLSLTEIGVVLAAEWVGLTFALLPWGFAVDRFGERDLERLLVGGGGEDVGGVAQDGADVASLTVPTIPSHSASTSIASS